MSSVSTIKANTNKKFSDLIKELPLRNSEYFDFENPGIFKAVQMKKSQP